MVLKTGCDRVEMLRETVEIGGIDPAILDRSARMWHREAKLPPLCTKADRHWLRARRRQLWRRSTAWQAKSWQKGARLELSARTRRKTVTRRGCWKASVRGRVRKLLHWPVCSSARFRRSRRGIYLFGGIFGRQFRTGDYEPAQ